MLLYRPTLLVMAAASTHWDVTTTEGGADIIAIKASWLDSPLARKRKHWRLSEEVPTPPRQVEPLTVLLFNLPEWTR